MGSKILESGEDTYGVVLTTERGAASNSRLSRSSTWLAWRLFCSTALLARFLECRRSGWVGEDFLFGQGGRTDFDFFAADLFTERASVIVIGCRADFSTLR